MKNGIIVSVVRVDEVPPGAELHDFGESTMLPGLVDSHVHINDPGRADWEALRPRQKLQVRVATRCWWICLSIVYRQPQRLAHLRRSAAALPTRAPG